MTTLVIMAVIVGGFYLVRRASSFRSGLVITLCVCVLLGLVVASQP
jgi:hypothetical protein